MSKDLIQLNPLAAAAQFTEDDRQAIAHHVGIEATNPALLPFLSVAASMGLSPLSGEIWLLKGERETSGGLEIFYRPAVGRDGFLKKARETDNFKGIRSDVVRAKDTYEVEHTQDGLNFVHRHASLGEGVNADDQESHRGAVRGAWGLLEYKDGTSPFFFFAEISEYARTKTVVIDGHPQEVPEGTWAYLSAMILKCAQSYVCRIGCGISGAVPVDELKGGGQATGVQPGVQRDQRIDADPTDENDAFIDALDKVTPETRKALKEALREANQLTAFSWAPAKVSIVLNDADQHEAEKVLAGVEREISLMQRRIHEEEEAAAAAVEAEGKPAIQVIQAHEVAPGQMISIAEAREEEPWRVGRVSQVEGRVQIEEKGAEKKGTVELERTDEVELHDIPNPAEAEGESKDQ